MSDPRNETEAKVPYLIVEEHDGSRMLSLPARGINREMMQSMVYGGTTIDNRIVWHWFGNFTDACEVVAYMFENNPGMQRIVEGLLEMRASNRAMRKAEQEKGV